MTAREREDLGIAIGLIRDLSKKLDAIPQQIQDGVSAGVRLHVAERHAGDAEVVREVNDLVDAHKERWALGRFFSRNWRALVVGLTTLAVALEILEIFGVI
jgi:predicted benzoate:H+ symporter BenE